MVGRPSHSAGIRSSFERSGVVVGGFERDGLNEWQKDHETESAKEEEHSSG